MRPREIRARCLAVYTSTRGEFRDNSVTWRDSGTRYSKSMVAEKGIPALHQCGARPSPACRAPVARQSRAGACRAPVARLSRARRPPVARPSRACRAPVTRLSRARRPPVARASPACRACVARLPPACRALVARLSRDRCATRS